MTTENVGPLGLAKRAMNALTTYRALVGTPTDEQYAAMRAWPGWGPLAHAFDRAPEGGWKQIQEDLFELLDKREEAAAREAVDTAFYTSDVVTSAIWRMFIAFGFTGGNMLDPGCGDAAFYRGCPGLPISYTGVEIDPTSAGIAQVLHPEATIVNAPLQRTMVRHATFDIVGGNFPFSKKGPYDPTWPTEEAGGEPNLHGYFTWRGLQALRAGGFMIFVTSRYTMDAVDDTQRAWLSTMGEFIGAIRLPSGAFGQLGTNVVTDILVLRRRPQQEQTTFGGWLTATERPELQTSINEYWDAHPQLVLGEMRPRGGVQSGMTLDVIHPKDVPLADSLNAAVDWLVADATARGIRWEEPENPAEAFVDLIGGGLKEGAFELAEDGTVTRVEDGQRVAVPKASAELRELILLRDAALDLFELEGDPDRAASDITPTRDHAFALYQGYVSRYGPVNRSTVIQGLDDSETGLPTYGRRVPGMSGFRNDPDFPIVLALEEWDDDTQAAEPAQILVRRVNARPKRVTRTDDPAEAVALCIDQVGAFSLDHARALLDVDIESAIERLYGHIYQDPETGEWVSAEKYLSGDVRSKLDAAVAAADTNPAWSGNVDALRAVQPRDLTPEEVVSGTRVGSPWIPTDIIALFVARLLEGNPGHADKVRVVHERKTGRWELHAAHLRKRPGATVKYGTARANAVDLIQHALNNTSPVVKDTIEDIGPDGKKRKRQVRNNAETQLAEAAQARMQEEFTGWIFSDPERTERLMDIYNRRFNADVLERFDGQHLTFAGFSGVITPYRHQLDMVCRMLQTPSAMCGYAVGSGKTPIQVMGAVKMKQLGLAKKPLLIVPKHILEQTAAMARRLFPAARILMVTKDDLTPKRRRLFAAKVAATDWDLIVMTHQQFTSIPVSPAMEEAYILEQIDALTKAVNDPSLEGSRTSKGIARQIKALKKRHEKLMDRGADTGLTFEMLGIDVILVDEWQYFKNLFAASSMEGFSMPASQRAEDLFLKVTWMRARNDGGRCLYGFSGTLISNSLAEAHTLARYAMPDQLERLGIEAFDAFAGQFIQYVTKIEVAPDGSGFRSHRRPSRFVNVPELRTMLNRVMDVRDRKSLNLGGPAQVVFENRVTPGPPEQQSFIDELVRRADRIRMGGVKPKEDNMLAICNDGRAVSVDLRLKGITPSLPDKIDDVVFRVAELYHQHKNDVHVADGADTLFDFEERLGGCQLVFLDLGTPHKADARVYGRIRRGLIAAGVPREQIAFSHDAKSDMQRKELYARANDGRLSVFVASTGMAGTGVNIQRRLFSIHHVDPTWRPDEIEQRNGRGIRPGNLYNLITIVRYLNEGSFDPYMWQGLERKAAFIFQLLSGEINARVVDDVLCEDVMDFARLKALSTGQELLMDLADADAELAALLNERAGHYRDQGSLRSKSSMYASNRITAIAEADVYERIAAIQADDPPRVLAHSTRLEGQEAAESLAKSGRFSRTRRYKAEVGQYRGVSVSIEVVRVGKRTDVVVRLSSPKHWRDVSVILSGNVLKKGQEMELLAAVDKAIDSAADRAAAAHEYAAYLLTEIEEIKPMLLGDFPRAKELNAARERRDAIRDLIAAEMKHTPEEVLVAA